MKSRPSYPTVTKLSYVIQFGKHKGKTVEQIIKNDPFYILWASDEKILQFSQEILDIATDASWEQTFDDEESYRSGPHHNWSAYYDDDD